MLEIEDGKTHEIKCVGTVNESICDILGQSINMGTQAVGQKKSSNFTFRNDHNKFYAIF